MLVFIDESGDAGFKINKGSSRYFVISLIIFASDLVAEETALTIKKLKLKFGLSEKHEFKFNKSNLIHRTNFLKTVKPYDFSIRAIVIDKEKIYSSHLRYSKEDFYSFVLKQVLEHNSGKIRDAKIRLDGRGERLFKKQLTTYLRKYLNSDTKVVMKNLRFRDSKNDVLIQLADMVAGSLRRYYDHKHTDWNIYRRIIKSKEDNVWEFM